MRLVMMALLFALTLIYSAASSAADYDCDGEFTKFVAGQVVPMEDNVFVFCFPLKYKSGVTIKAEQQLRGRISINGEMFESTVGVPGELGVIPVPGYIQLANEADIAICFSGSDKCSEVTRISGTFHNGILLGPGKPRTVPAVP